MTDEKRKCPRPGWCGYVDILKSLMDAPATSAEMSERMNIGACRMRIILNRFHELGVIHISDWAKKNTVPTGARVAVFSFGKAPDAPGKGNGRQDRKPRKLVRQVEQTQVVYVMRLLMEPITKLDLAKASGSGERSVLLLVNRLHQHGMCHISEWVPSPKYGAPVAMYKLGSGKDAKRPIPLTRAQMSRNAWERRKQRNHMQRLINAMCSNSETYSEAA